MRHTPVLLSETVDALSLNEKSIVVDATLGAGGHTSEILTHLGKEGVLISLDADPAAVLAARTDPRISGARATVHLVNENFRNIDAVLEGLEVDSVNAIVADLGWRSEQMEGHEDGAAQRGFSFLHDEPLVMTYGDPKHYAFTARDIINEWTELDIANVLKGYGEERFARKIAKKIVEVRKEDPIERTVELVAVINSAVPGFYRRAKIHPATRTFQALRIAVNDELDALASFIEKGIAALAPRGRLAIISFHSIEDRIVKQAFREAARDHHGTLITKKPITASQEEITENPRARSAKLRILEKA